MPLSKSATPQRDNFFSKIVDACIILHNIFCTPGKAYLPELQLKVTGSLPSYKEY